MNFLYIFWFPYLPCKKDAVDITKAGFPHKTREILPKMLRTKNILMPIVFLSMAGKSKSGFSDFCQIQWIWIWIGFGFFGTVVLVLDLSFFWRTGFGFGFKDLTGFGFGFEHRWICPSLISIGVVHIRISHWTTRVKKKVNKKNVLCQVWGEQIGFYKEIFHLSSYSSNSDFTDIQLQKSPGNPKSLYKIQSVGRKLFLTQYFSEDIPGITFHFNISSW